MPVTTTIAGFFSALGFVAWIVGYYWDLKGVATIGGGIVLILGGWVTVDGLQYRSGTVTDNDLTTVNNSTANGTDVEIAVNDSTTTFQYKRVSGQQAFRTGFTIMLLGAALIWQALAMEVS